MKQATAVANPNIALIKYWGNTDDALRLPANGSISFSLAGLETVTTVRFDPGLSSDALTLNQRPASTSELERVSQHLDLIREAAGMSDAAAVVSSNNFPTGAGIASSAAAFAALTLAACAAAGLDLELDQLSRMARRGSGSAARSIHPGYVELHAGQNDEGCFAESIAPPQQWALVDLTAVLSPTHKQVGSTEGHRTAATSPLQSARVEDAPRRLDICRRAIEKRDFDLLTTVVELDSNLMHAVMMTSDPPLFYWEPHSIELMQTIVRWRKEGLPVCYTLDAGPNVHCLTTDRSADEIEKRLQTLPYVAQTYRGRPGNGARLVDAALE